MPQVTVYIREEDLDRWKAIKKKSEFMHRALNGTILKLDGQVIKEIKTAPIARSSSFEHPKKPLQVNPKSHTYIDRDQLP